MIIERLNSIEVNVELYIVLNARRPLSSIVTPDNSERLGYFVAMVEYKVPWSYSSI